MGLSIDLAEAGISRIRESIVSLSGKLPKQNFSTAQKSFLEEFSICERFALRNHTLSNCVTTFGS
jgi:hypothetical protein